MIVAVVVLAVIVVVLAGALALSSRSGAVRVRELNRRAEDARTALRQAEAEHSEDQRRIVELTNALGAARQALPAPPRPPAADGPRLGVLWALSELELARSRRHAEALSTASPAPGTGGGLAATLDEEVSRLREEIGTPGTLRVALEGDLPAPDAELLYRAVQSLLAVLCRHCQGYDLYIHRFERRLLAALVCEGFDGPESVADEAAELNEALRPVDGRLELDRDPQGRLRARLSVPATA